MANFDCSRCGACCTNIIGKSGELEFGIYLEPKDIDNFSPESVFPLLGKGSSIEITAYQVGTINCPNYVEKEGKGSCQIYDKRPLVCKSFPVISRFKLSEGCPAVQKATDGINLDSLKLEMQAHNQRVGQLAKNSVNEWIWPLNLKRWIPLNFVV